MNTEWSQEILKFDSVVNFREIGGFKTEDGRMMKSGKLFRSEDLSSTGRFKKDLKTIIKRGYNIQLL